MASSVLVPVGEYLETTYRPDCDYIDGKLRERNSGEQPHAGLQIILGSIFRTNRVEWGVRPLVDQRVQITSTRYRVADVCVLRNTDPKDLIIHFAPLLCIEILSRGDSLDELQERVMITRASVSAPCGPLIPGSGLGSMLRGVALMNQQTVYCGFREP